MIDKLGNRMKEFYEDRTRYKLPRRTNIIIRVDGKAFHTYTRGLMRPFDKGIMEDMNATAEFLCKNIQGAKFAYVQSDEISIFMSDYDTISTDMWFDGNVQKMTSIAASLATVEFNRLRLVREMDHSSKDWSSWDLKTNFKSAMFDARVFTIPSIVEVENYFVWRQQDATRNSISSVAQSLYSHKELNGKSTKEMQEMIFQKGINWNDYTPREKRGGLIRKIQKEFLITANGPEHKIENKKGDSYIRNVWECDAETPIFSQNKEYLREFFPYE